MLNRSIVALAALGILTFSSLASARTDVFVHGRNSGIADVTGYWQLGGGNDAVTAFSGNNTEGRYTYGYDASRAWTDLSDNNAPVCQLTNALLSAPGTDMAVVTHSAGGPVALYMMALAQSGYSTPCSTAPATAKAWVTYIVPIASPFRGTEVANAVYGQTGGNFLQRLCGGIAGSVANLVFNERSSMTYALKTDFMANNYNGMVAYGSFSAIYENFGTGTGGDDGTALSGAAYCANVESSNDGFIGPSSATGCTRGTAIGTNCLPGGHTSWWDGVSHSSNRRNDYNTFAAHVWSYNPY